MTAGRTVLGLFPAAALLGVLLCSLAAEGAAPAAEPGHDETPLTPLDRRHWAFRPVQHPQPPRVSGVHWCRTPIDRFILAALERRGLVPMPAADRHTLLRRVTFDLTGLPPTPEEMERFLADDSPDAYERVVDRLLASPAYGERWALHWLDLARFAETDGFEHDHVRPQAWRYRDWVITALNDDLPYDRFVALQLAADEIAPDDRRAQLATGFLLAGPDMPDINLQEERRLNFLNGMTANIGEVLLGMQFGCAQCHDHKADPLSQYDFYRLRACLETIDLFTDQPLEVTADGDLERTLVKARITRTAAQEPGESRLWIRGDFRRPGPVVVPGVPRVAVPQDERALLPNPHTLRRQQLAEWVVSPDNPLTARVIVNRLWQYHFGVGIAPTTSDFGLMGVGPTHPELLDWLASELMQSGWSLKRMHRWMVTSAVYRTASRPSSPAGTADATSDPLWRKLVELDPDNELLGRMRRRRLEGEAIRDALLAVTGQLNTRMGGPGVRPPLPPEVVQTLLRDQWPVTEDVSEHHRRSIYLFVRRNLKYPLFDVFDRPDQNLSCSRRQQTTIAPQALALLNSELAWQAAERLAERLVADDSDPNEGIRGAYRLLYGREATAVEVAAARRFVELAGSGGWTDLALALINASEFVYVD